MSDMSNTAVSITFAVLIACFGVVYIGWAALENKVAGWIRHLVLWSSVAIFGGATVWLLWSSYPMNTAFAKTVRGAVSDLEVLEHEPRADDIRRVLRRSDVDRPLDVLPTETEASKVNSYFVEAGEGPNARTACITVVEVDSRHSTGGTRNFELELTDVDFIHSACDRPEPDR